MFITLTGYTEFYNKIKQYANSRASRLFSDITLRADAVDKAMDKMVDWLLTKQRVDSEEAFAKTIVSNSLKNSSRLRKLEVIGSGEDKVYQIIVKKRGRKPNN